MHRLLLTALAICLLGAGTARADTGTRPAASAWAPAVYRDFPVRVELEDGDHLARLLAAVPVASFHREQLLPMPGGGLEWRPRVTAAEARALLDLGTVLHRLPDAERRGRRAVEAAWADRAGDKALPAIPESYPTVDEIGPLLLAVADDHPAIARRLSWGTSVQGRTLWGLVVSDDVANTEPEPEVRLSSTMHGDEPVGTVLLLALADHLTDNYGQPGFEDLTALVDGTELHLLPLHNPDGYAVGVRQNSRGLDLNRDFEDFATGVLAAEPENVAFADYGAAHSFVLSANLHTGALVVNYLWDHTYDRAPDDAALILLATGYADLNPPMAASPSFPGGITNGADWFRVDGTLQDWMYRWQGCLDATIELNNQKWPPAAQLPDLWDDNRDALVGYVAAAGNTLRGVVTDAATGAPLAATVAVTGIAKSVATDPEHGDYYKLLPTGTWEVVFAAEGYASRTETGVATVWGEPKVLDAALERTSPVPTTPVAAVRAAPNPFNGGTTLTYVVPSAGQAALEVFDLRGRRVRALRRGFHAAGPDSVTWDGMNDAGGTAAAGVYVVRLESPQGRALAKLTFLK